VSARAGGIKAPRAGRVRIARSARQRGAVVDLGRRAARRGRERLTQLLTSRPLLAARAASPASTGSAHSRKSSRSSRGARARVSSRARRRAAVLNALRFAGLAVAVASTRANASRISRGDARRSSRSRVGASSAGIAERTGLAAPLARASVRAGPRVGFGICRRRVVFSTRSRLRRRWTDR
jgi:hypothetical protein